MWIDCRLPSNGGFDRILRVDERHSDDAMYTGHDVACLSNPVSNINSIQSYCEEKSP